MAEEPIPASQAKMIFLISVDFSMVPGTTASPFAWAFLEAISFCASSRLLLPAIRTNTEAMAKEIPAEKSIPTRILSISGPGAIIMYAMIDPGEAGPTRPHPVILNQNMAAILPMMGAMITRGFMRIYGK